MISRRSFLSQLGLVAAVGGGAWWLRKTVIWPDPKLSFPESGTSGWLPFTEPGQDIPIVVARIGDTDVETLLDSGAQSSVIDRGLADRLGLKAAALGPLILGAGLTGEAQLGRATEIDVRLGDLTIRKLRPALFDLAAVARASGRGFGLILGQDVMSHVVADLDFPGQRMALADLAGYVPPLGAREVPVRRKGRELLVPIAVEGHAFEAVLDTGSSSTLSLSEHAAQAAGLLQDRPYSWAPSVSFGGLGQDRVVRVSSLALAHRSWRDIPVRIHVPNGRAALPDGLIGVDAFTAVRLIVDVGSARLYVYGTF